MKEKDVKHQLPKALSGIKGLDEITNGGLPRARPTLVTGYAGSGKTVLAMQFILNGIVMYNEPGVFISLEETEEDLRNNMASFGYDLKTLENSKMLYLENVRLQQSELYFSGHFDLSPLFIRIEDAINKVSAKRIAIDTFELIFKEIQEVNIFRQELLRLILWLKERNLTAVFTSESHGDILMKSGIEEYITDCVINLKNIVSESVYTRRLHILKYRGSGHGTNEYPFLIDENGISILPVTSVEIHQISDEIISTGIAGLDENIGIGGLYVGSSTLISGTAGVGKTSIALSICMQAMQDKKKKCLFFSFEESLPQLRRNMKSIGFELEKYEEQGLLKIMSTRPSLFGIETHLLLINREIEKFDPDMVFFDPITDLIHVANGIEVKSMLFRLIDFLKSRLITIIFTVLVPSGKFEEDMRISSLVDNWIEIKSVKTGLKRYHGISIIKIRGTSHSRTEFMLGFSKDGLRVSEFDGINMN